MRRFCWQSQLWNYQETLKSGWQSSFTGLRPAKKLEPRNLIIAVRALNNLTFSVPVLLTPNSFLQQDSIPTKLTETGRKCLGYNVFWPATSRRLLRGLCASSVMPVQNQKARCPCQLTFVNVIGSARLSPPAHLNTTIELYHHPV